MKRVNHFIFFFSISSSPRRCLSESRWARVEMIYKITNARTLHYPRVGGWKSSGFLSFTLFCCAMNRAPNTECEHCGELDDHSSLRSRRKDARNRTQKHKVPAHTHRASARSIKLKQIVLVKCGKSATFSILFRVVVVVSIALDVIVTIGLSRPRHCITYLLYSIFYVHIDWICTFSFFHRSGSGLLLFTCLVWLNRLLMLLSRPRLHILNLRDVCGKIVELPENREMRRECWVFGCGERKTKNLVKSLEIPPISLISAAQTIALQNEFDR